MPERCFAAFDGGDAFTEGGRLTAVEDVEGESTGVESAGVEGIVTAAGMPWLDLRRVKLNRELFDGGG